MPNVQKISYADLKTCWTGSSLLWQLYHYGQTGPFGHSPEDINQIIGDLENFAATAPSVAAAAIRIVKGEI